MFKASKCSAGRDNTSCNLLNRNDQISYGGLLEGIGPTASALTVKALLLGALREGLKALRTTVHRRTR